VRPTPRPRSRQLDLSGLLDRILPHLDLEGGETAPDVVGTEPERELIAA
jgi:hypothetical protein